MILERWTNKRTGCTYRRITKSNARRVFIDGHCLIVAPCKANMNSPWCNWSMYSYNGIDEQPPEKVFERVDNSFRYYNCNNELGLYPKYFIPESVYKQYYC